MNYITALEDFITYLRIHRNSSPKTIEQYELHLVKFLEFHDPECLLDSDNRPINHRFVFVESVNEPINRAKKNAFRTSIRTKCRLDIENVNLGDLNEFRLSIAEK